MKPQAAPHTTIIVRELDRLMGADDGHSQAVNRFAEQLMNADRAFVAGAGRSGLMGKAFAMRLMHLGFSVYVVGETVTPGIAGTDVLVLGSGSGETGSLTLMADKAKRIGASVLLVTVNPESTLSRMADGLAVLPAAVKHANSDAGADAVTVQPMGSLFEQGLLLFYDAVILKLMELKEMRGDTMYGNHANLE